MNTENIIRWKILHIAMNILLFFFLPLNVDAMHNDKIIKELRITYTYVDGYAFYTNTATYILKGNDFILQTRRLNKTFESRKIPVKIKGEIVNEFSCQITSRLKDFCSYTCITDDDFNSYQQLINNKERINKMVSFRELKLEKYKALTVSSFINLSCDSIMGILSNPTTDSPYPTQIDFIYSDNSSFSLSPDHPYKGLPWCIKKNNTTSYVDYNNVMLFIEEIGFMKFINLKDREYLMMYIADALVGD